MARATDNQPAQQLILDLPFRPALGREDFFVSPANEAAVAAIDKWPDWPNHVLILVGPEGSGKSHLANVWQSETGASLITASQLNIDNLPELLTSGALVVEDLPGSALAETALFHLINLAREKAASLLLTSRQPPSRWGVKLPDLATRLKAATYGELTGPDDTLLRAVLIKHFYDRQIEVDEKVISFILLRMERSMARLSQIVDEIDRQSMVSKRRITRQFVSSLMARQGDTS